MSHLGKRVSLKGRNEGYILLLDDNATIEEILQETEELFKKIKKDDLYDQTFELVIDSGNRLLTQEQKEKISKIINNYINFDIKRFNAEVIDIELANEWHKDTSPLIMVKNIRNGQIIRSERDIILIGDVRPGGLIRSTGSIIIIGEIHGTVHAGSKGDEEAIIIAPFAYNGQVRIGEHVEIIEVEEEENTDKNGKNETETKTEHQVVFLNDLHVIEFADVNELGKKRPDFAKDLGGFEEWQKQL